MIKKQRTPNKIENWYADIFETGRNSSVFEIYDFPTLFKLGKNYFKIKANSNQLIKGTDVYIELTDSNGNSIYHEISSMVNSDNTRNVVVYVYEDTAPGQCRLLVRGTVIGHKEYMYRMQGIVDTSKTVSNEIQFLNPPKVYFSERQVPVQNFVTGSRFVEKRNVSGSVYLKSITQPRNLTDSRLEVERERIDSKITNIPNTGGLSGYNSAISDTKYTDRSILTSNQFAFTSSMEGGQIILNSITIESPPDAANQSIFSNINYSASIVKVVNSSSIEVYPPFLKSVEYTNTSGIKQLYSTNTIKSHTNFTCSYFDSLTLLNTATTRSFVNFQIFDLDPEIGNVDSILVKYKPVNDFGDFRNLGEYSVRTQNALISSNSIEFSNNEVAEKQIGIFRTGLTDFYNYWHTQSFGTGSIVIDTFSKVQDGVRIYQTSSRGTSDRWLLRPFERYSIDSSPNSIFELSFNTFSEFDSIFQRKNQIDIYISGSDIEYQNSPTSRNLDISPIETASFGTYIGSVTSDQGKSQTSKFYFKTKDSNNFLPIFVFRNGIWSIGDIKVQATSPKGFTPNQNRFYLPLENVENTELVLRVDYLNSEKKASDYSSYLYGVKFTGIPEPELVFAGTIKQSIGTGKRTTYLYQESASIDSGGSIITATFPVFVDEFDVPYTGSQYNFGIGYTIETIVYAKTGSFAAPKDTYIWAGTVQGRSLWNPWDATLSSTPILFGVNAFSGSSQYLLGTYGQGGSSSPIKANLDSWFKTTIVYVNGGTLNVRYTITSTGSGVWDGYLVSTCNVIKYEQEV